MGFSFNWIQKSTSFGHGQSQLALPGHSARAGWLAWPELIGQRFQNIVSMAAYSRQVAPGQAITPCGWWGEAPKFFPLTLVYTSKSSQVINRATPSSGPGFDYQKVMSEFVDATSIGGRGIRLVRSLCKRYKYMGRGNKVQAVYSWEE